MRKRIKLKRGTVIRAELRKWGIVKFDHFGIYAGNKKVIHFRDDEIRRESLDFFVEKTSLFFDEEFDVMAFKSEFTKNVTLEMSYQRALQLVGTDGYDLFDNNCEHFALWCRTGSAHSGQALGSTSDAYSQIPLTGSFGNIPRLIGWLYNDLGMEKSRTIEVSDL